jgi:hypothetical protein
MIRIKKVEKLLLPRKTIKSKRKKVENNRFKKKHNQQLNKNNLKKLLTHKKQYSDIE